MRNAQSVTEPLVLSSPPPPAAAALGPLTDLCDSPSRNGLARPTPPAPAGGAGGGLPPDLSARVVAACVTSPALAARLAAAPPAAAAPVVAPALSARVVAAARRREHRAAAGYRRARAYRAITESYRGRVCLTQKVPKQSVVTLHVRADQATGEVQAHFAGVARCGRLGCPWCRSITNLQNRDLGYALANAHVARRGGLAMLTFTVSHRRGDRYTATRSKLRKALRAFWESPVGRAINAACIPGRHIRALENKYGEHGHHPHGHYLCFLRPGAIMPTDRQIRDAWARACKLAKVYTSPDAGAFVTRYEGSDPDQVRQAAGYLCKGLAEEMSAGTSKGQKTAGGGMGMWDVLEAAAAGSAHMAAVWREWEEGSKGENPWKAGKGLAEELGIDPDEYRQPDGELGETFYELLDFEYSALVRCGREVRALEYAEQGDLLALRGLLALCLAESPDRGRIHSPPDPDPDP